MLVAPQGLVLALSFRLPYHCLLPAGCSELEEVRQAVREHRPANLSAQAASLQRSVHSITAVGAQLGAASIDRRIQPLSWQLLQIPPVVGLMQVRLRALAGCQLASLSTLAPVTWQAPAGKVGAAKPAKPDKPVKPVR